MGKKETGLSAARNFCVTDNFRKLMALTPRIMKAFHGMKDLGIPKETVKPVLKKLLKLYDNNWELIEEDNYRTLADAIFESADEKVCSFIEC